jgi:SAM-dependent methyltransferase
MSVRFLRGNDSELRLHCPICRAELSFQESSWRCNGADAHAFPEVSGVPILLNPDRSMFRAADFEFNARTTFKEPAGWAVRVGRILPSPSRDVSAQRCRNRIAGMLAARPADRRRVLVIGCGDGSANYGAMLTVDGAHWLETDVSLAGSAAIVCDASDLPFGDGLFDLVICVAVLEHVLEPERCVQELRRVLVQDGLVYAATPFMQQVHMGEYDFTRYSHAGHRWLFRHFDEIDSGVATGPASVLVWSVEYFLLSWTRTIGLRRVIKGSIRLLFGWLTLLDGMLAHRTAAHDAAGGFYFIGRRGETPITPREMIAYYRGADAKK